MLLLFILVPLAEVGVFIQVGGLIGLWPTLALTVLTAIIGSICIRWQGLRLVGQARAQLQAGEAPVFEVVSG
ncbi:MAG TPA: FxsA family protein, partial [Geminicoccaceae bacterium]|nr:FxsA family protein [Geminicoccaceae bacterium]